MNSSPTLPGAIRRAPLIGAHYLLPFGLPIPVHFGILADPRSKYPLHKPWRKWLAGETWIVAPLSLWVFMISSFISCASLGLAVKNDRCLGCDNPKRTLRSAVRVLDRRGSRNRVLEHQIDSLFSPHPRASSATAPRK